MENQLAFSKERSAIQFPGSDIMQAKASRKIDKVPVRLI
jgi:hypothetical protein